MKAGKLVLFLAAGGLFGTGLAVSGMTDPARVIGFLDVFGRLGPGAAFCHGWCSGRLWIGNGDTTSFRRLETTLGRIVADRLSACNRIRDFRGRLGIGRVLPWTCACQSGRSSNRSVVLRAGNGDWHVAGAKIFRSRPIVIQRSEIGGVCPFASSRLRVKPFLSLRSLAKTLSRED